MPAGSASAPEACWEFSVPSNDCPICDAQMRDVFSATLLGRHRADYQSCPSCAFLRVRDPHWLEEAYSSPIAVLDTGLMMRNLFIADQLSALCPLFSKSVGPYLDSAGGYGVLVRLMRDRGFDFWWSDGYSQNLLARGFEYTPDIGPCIAVTAFEVMEHLERPVEFVKEAMAAGQSDIFIFSTELFEGPPPSLGWHYYVREAGQHISFYRRDTLERLGARLGLHFHSHANLHFLSRERLDARRIARALSRPGRLLARLRNRRRQSLTEIDHARLKASAAAAIADTQR